jgi:hypothetical protein
MTDEKEAWRKKNAPSFLESRETSISYYRKERIPCGIRSLRLLI